MKFRALTAALGCLCASLAAVPSLSATTLSGVFTSDDQLFPDTWYQSQATNATIITSSYAGGGFVPVLALFDAGQGDFTAAAFGATAPFSRSRLVASCAADWNLLD